MADPKIILGYLFAIFFGTTMGLIVPPRFNSSVRSIVLTALFSGLAVFLLLRILL